VGAEVSVPITMVVVSFLFVVGMVFWKTTFSDLLDIQGDRIVGRATIPILIGATRTRRLLLYVSALLALLLIGSGLMQVIGPVGYWLLLTIAVQVALYLIYTRSQLVDRLVFEAIADANPLLAGLICMASWI